MGNATRKADKEERRANRKIERMNQKDHKDDQNIVKALLLGTGESGKSTIFKQARTLFGNGFGKDELVHYRPKVYYNIISQFQSILKYQKFLGKDFEFASSENEALGEFVLNLKPRTMVDPELASNLKTLWSDPSVRRVWNRRAEFQVLDCIEYYMKEDVLDRIAGANVRGKEGYIPTFDDVVFCRDRTTGVVVQKFKLKQAPFHLVDVGGQRSERRRWLACFDNVTTILFVTAINEYNQTLFEDNTTSRVEEAIQVWKDIINRPDFMTIGFVMFLNKYDLFERKVCEFPFRVEGGRNHDYAGKDPMKFAKGSTEREAAINECADFMKAKFQAVVEDPKRNQLLDYHYTTATNTNFMKLTFDTCRDQILRVALQGSYGFASI